MSSREVIHLLVDIVAKGGNLLLNIAPGPRGQWHEEAYAMLAGVGEWMKVNSGAIYETRVLAPYKEANICLTRKKDGKVYAIYLAGENEKNLPAYLTMNTISPVKGATITLLGTKTNLKWEKSGNGFVAEIPVKIRKRPPADYAWVFEISGIENPPSPEQD
jgi:alpha-L-fucosidase